jgi:hypothetical protein
MRKVESMNLQLLNLLLLELLLETRRRAGRRAGEQLFDEDARHHAERESIRPGEKCNT